MEYLIVLSVAAMITVYVWIFALPAARVTTLKARTRISWSFSIQGAARVSL
jgi:hypothetical protein